MTERCADCIFFESQRVAFSRGFNIDPAIQLPDDGSGYCHRFPHIETIRVDYWCGEFQPKAETEKPQ